MIPGTRNLQIRQEETNVASIVDSESGEEEDKEDDEGVADERGMWEGAHVTEEDFETTEGEAVRRRIYMTNSWRWQGGRPQTRRNRMT